MEKATRNRIPREKEIVIAAVFGALGVVIPILFHVIGLGSIFLPMYLPIAVLGFLVSIPAALATGIITPLFSAVVTGMPPFYPPIAPIMCIELSMLAGSISLFYRRLRWSIWISLICAILLSRLMFVLILWLVIPLLDLPPGVLTVAALVSGIPGILLMIAV